MKRKPDRYRIALTIIVCHLLLIGILVVLLISNSLLPEEFNPLLTLLVPVTAIYAGSVFRYLSNQIRMISIQPIDSRVPYANLIQSLILLHFMGMLFLLIAKAVFNWIDFSTMTILMTLLETSFGIYMGMIMNAVFGEK